MSLGKDASPFEWLDTTVLETTNRWQLDSKTEKVTTLSPGPGILTNK